MIRIVLVDDEPAVRRGLKMRLELTKEMRVVGEVGDGATALQQIMEWAPDVVIMDIELPGCDGISLTKQLRAVNAGATVLILSMHDDSETRARATAAGAAKFVSKHEGTDALLKAIRSVVLRRQMQDPDFSEKEDQ